MIYIYAALNQDDIVYDIMETEYEMVHPERIPITVADYTLVGKKYNRDDKTYSEVPSVEIREVSKLEFRKRFTLEELTTIYNSRSTDVVIDIFLDDLAASEYIDLNYPDIQNGLGYLYSKGYITLDRMNEILA